MSEDPGVAEPMTPERDDTLVVDDDARSTDGGADTADTGDTGDGNGGDGNGDGGNGDEDDGKIPASQAKGIAWLIVAGFAIVGFGCSVLAAFDVRIFGPWTVVIAGVGFVLLCAAAAGASVTAFVIERARPKWTPFSPATRIWFLLAGGMLTVFTLWGLWWLIFDASFWPAGKVGIVVAMLAAAAVGAFLTYVAADPDKLQQAGTVAALSAVKVIVGLALGAFLAIAPVIAVGILRTTRDVTLPDPPRITTPTDHFVALGDSYSAGEGLEPYLEGTQNVADGGNRCHRSRSAYSQQLDFGGSAPEVVFVACSGAISSDLFDGHTEPRSDPEGAEVPAQVEDGPPDPTVDLVTMTMGGNDVAFSDVVTRCLTVDDCVHQPFEPGNPDPTTTMRDWALREADALAGRLSTAYQRLRSHYPSARIVVLGYPYLFPGGKPGVRFSDCDTILRRVSTGERKQLRDLQDLLTAHLYRAAVAADIEFVSPVAVWDGHEPCGDRGQYTNAINPIVFDGSFHPNRAGQRAYATLLACYLGTTEKPAPGERVRLPWEIGVTDEAPAPGSLARPVPCPEAEPDS